VLSATFCHCIFQTSSLGASRFPMSRNRHRKANLRLYPVQSGPRSFEARSRKAKLGTESPYPSALCSSVGHQILIDKSRSFRPSPLPIGEFRSTMSWSILQEVVGEEFLFTSIHPRERRWHLLRRALVRALVDRCKMRLDGRRWYRARRESLGGNLRKLRALRNQVGALVRARSWVTLLE
jgi:hypothetical protein